MRAVFVDANETLAAVATRLMSTHGPEISINRQPDIRSEALPAAIDGWRCARVTSATLDSMFLRSSRFPRGTC